MNIVFMSMDTLPSTLWARDLYDQMHIRSDFRKWFPRMCQYGFIEGRDYEYMPRVRLQDEGGRTVQRYVKDYRITQDMAKKLCKLHHTAVSAAYHPQPFDWDALLGLLHKKAPRRSSYEAQLSDSDSLVTTTQMAVGFSTPAFAFVDATEVVEEPVQVIEEAEPTEEEKIPFTIAGNGEVEDNIVDDPSKEFFTVKTKGGNTFFLVIDRARNSENVYMLSMIDEYDLQEFLDDEERNGKQEEETPAVVLPETKPEPTPDVEIEEPKEESGGGMNKILLLVFVSALGGAGAFFYFYIYKPKPKEEAPQSENLETDQSLATVNEDNQSDNENGT